MTDSELYDFAIRYNVSRNITLCIVSAADR